jgi:hypothetical protein
MYAPDRARKWDATQDGPFRNTQESPTHAYHSSVTEGRTYLKKNRYRRAGKNDSPPK